MEKQKICFFDERPIAESSAVGRVVHPAEKHPANPVVTATEPWEMGGSGGDQRASNVRPKTVLYDAEDGVYKMWYRTSDLTLPDRGYSSKYLNMYAESEDGLEWEKPELGIFDYEGSTANNIIGTPPPKIPTVFRDPEAAPDRRYKVFSYYYDGTGKIIVMHSPDGVELTEYDENPIHTRDRFPNLGDASSGFYDPHEELYVGTSQLASREGSSVRRTCTYTSTDFRDWSPPREALAEDPRDRALAENNGADHAEYYSLAGHAYEGLWLGFTQFYEVGRTEGLENGSGPIDVRLALSRDRGETWEKTWHTAGGADAVIPRGPPGAFDHGLVGTTGQPIVKDDEIWFYYGGWDGGHEAEKRGGAMGIATWPLDRFVSYRSTGDVGTVTTVPITVTGEQLVVNADPTAGDGVGSVEVEVLDRAGHPLQGYVRETSTPIETDGLRHTVTWDAGSVDHWDRGDTLEPLQGRDLRFRFYLEDADLYTMAFA